MIILISCFFMFKMFFYIKCVLIYYYWFIIYYYTWLLIKFIFLWVIFFDLVIILFRANVLYFLSLGYCVVCADDVVTLIPFFLTIRTDQYTVLFYI